MSYKQSLDHLINIYNDSDPFVGWSDSMKSQVFTILKSQEKAAKKAKERIELFDSLIPPLFKKIGEIPLPDDSLDNFKSYYGFSDKPNLYPEILKKLGIQYYTKEHRKLIEQVSFGILPTMFTQDHYDDKPTYLRLANAFAFKIESNCYVAAMTTQLSKYIMDWSTIIGSTSFDEEGKIKFYIPITDIIPALAYLVRTRWLNEEAPPTWEMSYTPEDLQKHPMWSLTTKIISHSIHMFFIHHELAHIALGHLDNNRADGSVVKKSDSDEFEADIFSAHVVSNYLRDNFVFDDDKSFVQYACIGIIRIVQFMEVLDKYSDDNINKHPSGSQRANAIAHIFMQYFPEFTEMIKHYLAVSSGFNEMVSLRLENEK